MADLDKVKFQKKIYFYIKIIIQNGDFMERKTGLTAEDVWAMFAETDRLQKENAARQEAMQEARQAENDRQMQKLRESQEEAARRDEEAARRDEERQEKWDKGMQELRESQKETSRQIYGISSSNGRVAEEYFINSLKRKMEFAGIRFNDIEANRISKYKIKTSDGKEETRTNEFDIVMLNGSCIAIIEIKYKAKIEDVEDLVNRKLKNFKISHPEYKNFNVYLGLGSFSFDDRTVDKARELGVGLLEQIGETVEYQTGWIRAY
jgi:hypothetical protein